MGKPKPPKPTPPTETSAAQTGTNVSTAIANSVMGNINEYTPDGSTTVDQTGSYSWTDQYTGQSYTVPKFTRRTVLSPDQEAIQEQTRAASLNLASLGNNLSDQLGDKLTGNFTIGNEATEQRLWDLAQPRLTSAFAQDEEAVRTRLANQGIAQGSEAYNRELERLTRQQNDARNQLLLTGRAQATQEQFAEDNQRINQVGALMSGGQVQNPQFMGANISSIPTTDNAGIINNYDNQRMQAWQQQMQQRQAGIGGLFSLAGSVVKALPFSDKRLKKDIKKVGKLEGQTIYEYRMKGEPKTAKKRLGVMAQNVEKKRPDAVVKDAQGYRHVDYGKLFEMGAMA